MTAELRGFPGGGSGKEPACQFGRYKRHGFDTWVGKIPWGRKRQTTPGFLPGESHEQRSLVGYSPRGRRESDMTEATWHAHTQLRPYGLQSLNCVLSGLYRKSFTDP